jgi:hypothetical protein
VGEREGDFTVNFTEKYDLVAKKFNVDQNQRTALRASQKK